MSRRSKAASSSVPPKRTKEPKGKRKVVEEDYDTFRFIHKDASAAYDKEISQSFVPERFVNYEPEAFPYLQNQIDTRGWNEFLKRPPRDTYAGEIVREFYANASIRRDDDATIVRERVIKFDPETINAYYRIEWPANQRDELEGLYRDLRRDRISMDELKEFITLPGTVVQGIPKVTHKRLTQEAKAWTLILLAHFRPSKHNSDYGEDRIPLLYALTRGLSVNVGRIIHEVIEEVITKKNPNLRSFVFPHLIDGLCRNAGVDFGVITEKKKLTGVIGTATICKTLKLDYESVYNDKVYKYSEANEQGQPDEEGQPGLQGQEDQEAEQIEEQPSTQAQMGGRDDIGRLIHLVQAMDDRVRAMDDRVRAMDDRVETVCGMQRQLAQYVYAATDRNDIMFRTVLGDERYNAIHLPALPGRINLPPQPPMDQGDEPHFDEEEERARNERNR